MKNNLIFQNSDIFVQDRQAKMTDVIKKAENLISNKRIVVDGIATIDDSADYPIQEVKIKGNADGMVTGDVNVNIVNKNILPIGKGTSWRNKYKLSVTDNVFHIEMIEGTGNYVAFGIDNALRNANYGDYVAWKNEILKAGTYTLNYKYKNGSTSATTANNNFCRLTIFGRPKNNTGRVQQGIAFCECNSQDYSKTFTIDEDMEINCVLNIYGVASVDLYFEAQLTKGSVADFNVINHINQNQLLSFGNMEISEEDIIQRIDDIWCLNETPISDETLVAQLNKLRLSNTYKGTTNFILLGDNVTPTLEVTYKQDIEKRISDLENAIVSLGANV